jgi:type IV pilus assembly protein PilA
MKLFQKKKNNKGFSLVELIVVVAIMAVLMGILVPTLVKNVEKSKKQKDESAIEEIRSQMQNSLADPKFSHIGATITYEDKTNKDISITSPDGSTHDTATSDDDVTKFLAEVSTNVDDYDFTSKDYKADPKVVYVIENERVKVYRAAAKETVPAGAPGAETSSADKP